ncbi:hypothetical protein [Massilia sp. 9096]|uniref:hypothetical protein n=1 Tax=Massilia sp. 9096 TaxID=1500894 RepID=UPI0012DFEC15|nr:hypothetical protein [Massilia sp. 9096]
MHSSNLKKSYSFPALPHGSSVSLPEFPSTTLAQVFSEAMGNDGQCFKTLKGVAFSDMLERVSPWGVRRQYVAEGGIARYELADGSAIIETNGCWDIEHVEHRFWMACGSPDEDVARRHAGVLERAGYCTEPADINRAFSKDLSPEELLFCRIFDVAIAQEPDENTPASNIRNWLERRADERGLAEAAHKLASRGPSYGDQNGALGGVALYEVEVDAELHCQVVWGFDHVLWTTLETMLLLAEEGWRIPDWYDDDMVFVRDANNAWVDRSSLTRI